MRIHVDVLGPLRVRVDGAPSSIGGPLPRALVARLIVAAGETVPESALIEDLWRGRPPASAVSTLHGYVSTVRRVLETEHAKGAPRVLVRDGVGYSIPRDAVTVDAGRFDRLVELARTAADDGDHELAMARLDEALAEWRGPAFADLADWDFAAHAATGLHARREAAILDRLAALSEVGRYDDAVADLRSAVERDPLVERAWELLALAEYRAGRQAAAMAALRRARTVLADELGAEPGPGLRVLYEAMLRHDPALLPRRTPPAPTRRTRYVPAELTSFTGRDDDVAGLARDVAAHRLVVLTGPGGVGKTRLAQRLAATSTDPDGPWFVELAGVHDADGIVDAVVDVLELTAQGGVDMLAALLRDRRCLLVLDNCEHLSAAVAHAAGRLLRDCPGLRILATSRVPLGVDGERIRPLDPLRDGTELFYDRSAVPLAAADRADVGRLCEALDNLPLALELAAAHTNVLSVRQLLSRLDDRMELLAARSPRTVGRHLSMRLVIDASYAALTPTQQELMQILAVFEGGFDFTAAAAVSGRGPGVLTDLAALVDASLIAVVGGDPRRYQMLEVLREYARGAAPSDLRDAVASAHTGWIGSLAGDAFVGLRGGDANAWMRRVEAELPNVRAALARCRDRDLVAYLEIVGDLQWFWYRRGSIDEGVRVLEPVATPAASAATAVCRIKALSGRNMIAYLAGDGATVGDSLARLQGALAELDPATGDADERAAIASAATLLAFFYAGAGAVDEAADFADVSRTVLDPTIEFAACGELELAVGTGCLRSGDADGAREHLLEAIRLADEVGYDWLLASACWVLAKSRIGVGDHAGARSLVGRMIEACDRSYDLTSWMVGVATLAYIAFASGDERRAALLTGVVGGRSELTGYVPETMDPIDLARYRAELSAGVDPDVLRAGTVDGARLDDAAVRDLIDVVVAG